MRELKFFFLKVTKISRSFKAFLECLKYVLDLKLLLKNLFPFSNWYQFNNCQAFQNTTHVWFTLTNIFMTFSCLHYDNKHDVSVCSIWSSELLLPDVQLSGSPSLSSVSISSISSSAAAASWSWFTVLFLILSALSQQ